MMFLFIITNMFLFNKKNVYLVVVALLKQALATTPIFMPMERKKENNLGIKKILIMNGPMSFKNLSKNMVKELSILVY